MTFKYPSLKFQYSARVRCKNQTIFGTVLPKMFNRKLGVAARKEHKIKIAFLLKKMQCPKRTVDQNWQEGSTQNTNLSVTPPQKR